MPKKLDLEGIQEKLRLIVKKASGYRYVVFIVVVAGLYGVLFLRINSLDSAQPSDEAISAQSKLVPTATIDKSAAKQLESLQNNNVNVQALFEQARNNPFEE